MRKILLIGALLTVSACNKPLSEYEPSVTADSKNRPSYGQDLAICKVEAEERLQAALRGERARTAGAFGAIGAVIASETANQDDDFNKTTPQMVDECMTAKGYKVIPQ